MITVIAVAPETFVSGYGSRTLDVIARQRRVVLVCPRCSLSPSALGDLRRALPGRPVVAVPADDDGLSRQDRALIEELLDEGSVPLVLTATAAEAMRLTVRLGADMKLAVAASARRGVKRRGMSVAMAAAIAVALVAVVVAIRAGNSIDQANGFERTTVDLGVTPTTVRATFSGTASGTVISQAIRIANATGSALRYAVSMDVRVVGPDRRADRRLRVKTIDRSTPGLACDDFDGDELFAGALDSAERKVVGDDAWGMQPGDRELGSGNAEILCFQVSRPLPGSGSEAAEKVAFTFSAERLPRQ